MRIWIPGVHLRKCGLGCLYFHRVRRERTHFFYIFIIQFQKEKNLFSLNLGSQSPFEPTFIFADDFQYTTDFSIQI